MVVVVVAAVVVVVVVGSKTGAEQDRTGQDRGKG